MSEEPEQDLKVALQALALQVREVDVGLDTPVKIRPLTWTQEMAIAGTVGKLVKQGVPQEVADREYMKLTVVAGLVDPKLTEKEVESLKIGVVVSLSGEIGKLSGGLQKK